MIDATLCADDDPYVLLPDDERPVLCLPPGKSAGQYEIMFGWAIGEVIHQRHGWLAVLRHVISMTGEPSQAA